MNRIESKAKKYKYVNFFQAKHFYGSEWYCEIEDGEIQKFCNCPFFAPDENCRFNFSFVK
jgi:hypothetical protein